MGEKRHAYRILVGKPGGKRPLGSPRRKWEDNIEMGLREIEWDGMDWIDLAEDKDQWRALINTVMNLRVSEDGKFLSSCTTGGFSGRTQLHGVSYNNNTKEEYQCHHVAHFPKCVYFFNTAVKSNDIDTYIRARCIAYIFTSLVKETDHWSVIEAVLLHSV
jgi:hypothetical protein